MMHTEDLSKEGIRNWIREAHDTAPKWGACHCLEIPKDAADFSHHHREDPEYKTYLFAGLAAE